MPAPSRHPNHAHTRNAKCETSSKAFGRLDDKVMEDGELRLSAGLICEMNQWVLEGVDPDATSAPGTIRAHSVVVGSYVGPPARDCWRLLERLTEWLDGEGFRPRPGDVDERRDAFALTVMSALLAHLYIAWIHPFADGNGRTARLLEYLILARSGMVPLAAANLMANHFNLTRDRYYARLAAASRERDVLGFLTYGIEGLVDGLSDRSAAVREQHLRLAWQSFVAETMSKFPTSPASERQHALVTALQPGTPVPKADVAGLTPQLAQMYARTGPRTLARDLNRLQGAGLIEVDRSGVRASDRSHVSVPAADVALTVSDLVGTSAHRTVGLGRTEAAASGIVERAAGESEGSAMAYVEDRIIHDADAHTMEPPGVAGAIRFRRGRSGTRSTTSPSATTRGLSPTLRKPALARPTLSSAPGLPPR